MSTWIVGFVPPDAEWQKMAAVYFACKEAKIDIPGEVERFFDDGEPDPQGQEISLRHLVREYEADMHQGLEIDIASLPKNVKTIRFYNAW